MGIALTVAGGAWGLVALMMVGIGLFSYFAFRDISPDSAPTESFRPAEYKGPMGRIVLAYKGESSLVVSPLDGKKQLRLTTKDGVLRVPIGIYKLEEFEAVARDKQGKKWTASCTSFWSAKVREVCVRKDSDACLDLGAPLTAAVVAEHHDARQAGFDLAVTGPYAETYDITGPGSKAPGFEVLDKAGKVVWQGKFEAG